MHSFRILQTGCRQVLQIHDDLVLQITHHADLYGAPGARPLFMETCLECGTSLLMFCSSASWLAERRLAERAALDADSQLVQRHALCLVRQRPPWVLQESQAKYRSLS